MSRSPDTQDGTSAQGNPHLQAVGIFGDCRHPSMMPATLLGGRLISRPDIGVIASQADRL